MPGLGIYFDIRNPDPSRDMSRVYSFTLELCEEAERLGADSVWFTEHHLFDDGYLPQPLTFAAAVAARTTRVRIGTAVLIAPFRSAVQIAEEAAVVDLVSGGRLELGLGAGYRVPEFDLHGADFARRYAVTDQRVRELRALWSEGKLTPAPAQDRLPIWVGYNGPKGARRAGLLGEGLLSSQPELAEPYRAGLAEAGHDVSAARMAGMLGVFVTDDPERDWPVVGRHHAYQWDSYRRYGAEGTGAPPPRPLDPDRCRAMGLTSRLGSLLYGTPDTVAEQIRSYIGDAPIRTVYLWASPGALPPEMAARHVELLCTQLAPLIA
jgi:alkanesulfonate monooxygenase SsuD/methylene tetrahydromethanopterin reductase-like flavin-dependent oxidoreductase (luciferase family)